MQVWSLVAQLVKNFGSSAGKEKLVKNLPTMQETQVQFLGWEDPLEKEMAIHSCILAWRVPWTEEPGRLQSMGSQSQTGLSDWIELKYGKMQQEGILSWTINRRQVCRYLWLWRPSPVIAHWVSYQQQPSSELGTSLPSNVGQNGREVPPKVWSDLWPQGGHINYKLALTKSIANDWTTKASRDWTPCCSSCWPSTTPWSEALGAPGNLVGQVFR